MQYDSVIKVHTRTQLKMLKLSTWKRLVDADLIEPCQELEFEGHTAFLDVNCTVCYKGSDGKLTAYEYVIDWVRDMCKEHNIPPKGGRGELNGYLFRIYIGKNKLSDLVKRLQ